MCGIHGFISGNTRDLNADDFMRSGFVAGSLRGMDSSGIASILVKQRTMAYQKLPISGSTFIQDKYADTLIRNANDPNTITLGHTRSATVGKVGYNEAHPFWVEEGDRELIGVHNGTLTGWKSYSDAKNYDVDSEWALNQIFDSGMAAFEKFSGAYCLSWWDSNDSETLNIALNKERPMHFALTEKGNMAFASEAGMLYWLLERHGVKIEGAVRALVAGNWYKFKINDVANYTKEALPASKYVAPVTTYPNYTSRKTIVEDVDELLTRIASDKASAAAPVQVPLLPAPPGPRTPDELNEVAARSKIMVLHNEQQTARDLMMMNERGTFLPTAEDSEKGITYGLFCQGDSIECDAIIRLTGLEWSADTVWVVTCIGAQDTGDAVTAICGRPQFNVKPKPSKVIDGTHVIH